MPDALCPIGRKAYTRKGAKREARAFGMVSYQCSRCGFWHVGNKRNADDMRKGQAKRGK